MQDPPDLSFLACHDNLAGQRAELPVDFAELGRDVLKRVCHTQRRVRVDAFPEGVNNGSKGL